MNPQFYIVLTQEQEKRFFSYILKDCKMKILVPLVTNGVKYYQENSSVELPKYMFVTPGNDTRITYAPFHMDGYLATEQIQGPLNFPYIEYWREEVEGQIVARIWAATTGKSFIQTHQIKKELNTIKEWIQEQTIRKEKLDGILQVYSLTGEIPTPDAGDL